jgi:hypothetical protein
LVSCTKKNLATLAGTRTKKQVVQILNAGINATKLHFGRSDNLASTKTKTKKNNRIIWHPTILDKFSQVSPNRLIYIFESLKFWTISTEKLHIDRSNNFASSNFGHFSRQMHIDARIEIKNHVTI